MDKDTERYNEHKGKNSTDLDNTKDKGTVDGMQQSQLIGVTTSNDQHHHHCNDECHSGPITGRDKKTMSASGLSNLSAPLEKDPFSSSSRLNKSLSSRKLLSEEFNAAANSGLTLASRIENWRKSKTAVIAVVALALFTDMVLYDAVVPILPTLLKNVGKDDSMVGVLFAIYAVGFLMATPAFSIWSDRAKTRKMPMILGQAGLALATVLFAFANSFWLLIVARLLQGIAAAVSWTLGLALLADTVPEEELGKAMGIVFGFHTLGYFVGPLMGGILTQTVNIQTPFLICSGLCVIDLIARAALNLPPPAEAKGEFAKNITIPRLLKHPKIISIGLIVIFTSLSFSAVETLLSSYLQNAFKLDILQVSLSMMAIIVPSVICSFIAGWCADRFNRYKMILFSTIVYIFATPLMGAAPSLTLFLIASAYFGATSSMLQAPTLPEMGTIVTDLGGGSYAQVYAILNICYSLGMLVGPLMASLFNGWWGFFVCMCITSAPCILMVPAFAWLSFRRERAERAERNDIEDKANQSPSQTDTLKQPLSRDCKV